jgi:hypothetical protein
VPTTLFRGGLVLVVGLLLLLPARGAAQTSPSPAAAAPASAASAVPVVPAVPATVDPKIEAMAKDWLHRVQTNTYDRAKMTDQMNTQLTPEMAAKVGTQFATLGDFTSFTYVDTKTINAITVYHFVVAFKSITLNEYLGLTADGKVAGLQFTTAQ